MKHTLLNHKLMVEGVPLHIVSSMAAGLMCAITTSPVDTIKTRVMNQLKVGKHLFFVIGDACVKCLFSIAQLANTRLIGLQAIIL